MVVDISAKQAEIHEITPQSDIVWVNSDGYCYWDPRYELSAVHCSVDVTWFPFDVQRCSLVFESWLLTVDKLSITLYDDADALDNYVPSDEWNLTCACSWTSCYIFTVMFWNYNRIRESRIRYSNECYEDDNEIQRQNGQIWPPSPAVPMLLNLSSANFEQAIKSGIPTTVQDFIQIGSAVSFPRMRNFATVGAKYDSASCGCLPLARTQDAVTDFWCKICQKTRFRARMRLLWITKPKLLNLVPFLPKTTIFGSEIDRTSKIFAR